MPMAVFAMFFYLLSCRLILARQQLLSRILAEPNDQDVPIARGVAAATAEGALRRRVRE